MDQTDLCMQILREDFGDPALTMRTNVMTPEGRMVVVSTDAVEVQAPRLETALRKVVQFYENVRDTMEQSR